MKAGHASDPLFRVVGHAHALRILFDVAATYGTADRSALIREVLEYIGHDLALAMPSPDCPEGWVEGMQDVEEALAAEQAALSMANGISTVRAMDTTTRSQQLKAGVPGGTMLKDRGSA